MNIEQNVTYMIQRAQIFKCLIKEQRYKITFSFFLNLLYAFYNGTLGLINQSMWFVTMCAYYIILSTMRFSAILCEYKNNITSSTATEYFVMKLSGAMLALLSFVLTGVIYISVSQNIATKYDEIIMITIATYTFYKITMAIIRSVKQRKNPSPLLAVIRNISYAEVAVSVLTLQRSMIVSFGTMDNTKAQTINILTGAFICLFMLILGILMIIRGIKKKGGITMAKSKLVKANEKIAQKVIGVFETIEDTVVSGYTKIEDNFVDRYLTKDGETVEEAKKRLKSES